jgi:DNA-binding transcriptional ArsR family regulator
MSSQVENQVEQQAEQKELPPVLPESVPVSMPDLPPRYAISTVQQFKAISDTTRTKILGIVQSQPATAKQIADRLGATPGAIGHHLRVLEEAGLVQIVARRLVRGIVANYYARTARIFMYEFPPEVAGGPVALDFIKKLRDEFAEAIPGNEKDEDGVGHMSYPHARLGLAKAEEYAARLDAIINDLLAEPQDPNGDVYGIFVTMFKSPAYMQGPTEGSATSSPVETDDTGNNPDSGE